jgi:ElaB/YqjD/DUF883 family membrane-anchored ribosome-binding protein
MSRAQSDAGQESFMDKSLNPTTVAGVASATMTEAVDAARDQYDSMLDAIRRSPLQAVAIAAGVGLVAALLVRH